MRRLLLSLLFWGFCSLAVAAQTAWDTFHQAVDALEFEQAQKVAETLPTGGPRELALAEVAVLSGRTDRSYPHTDRVDYQTLSPELKAKYYLVRAHQETTVRHALSADSDKAIARLISEGLRQPGAVHDHARLLLFRLEQTGRYQADPGRGVVVALAALQGADPILVVYAQAVLAERQGNFQESASLWSVLAQNLELKGKHRASLVHCARALNAQASAGLEVGREALLLMERARTGKDAIAAREIWSRLSMKIPLADRSTLLQLVVDSLPELASTDAKLLLMERLIALGVEPLKTRVARDAYTLAKARGDRLWEARMLEELSHCLRESSEGKMMAREFEAMLPTLDTRGDTRLAYMAAKLGRPVKTSTADRRWTVETLEQDLASLDPAEGPRERLFVLDRHLMEAIENGNAQLADRAFFQSLEEGLKLSPRDRASAMNFLLNAVMPGTWPHREIQIENLEGDLAGAMVKALGEKLSRRPDLVGRLQETQFATLQGQSAIPNLSAAMLSSWLAMLDRHDEAVEVLGLSLSSEVNERERAMAQAQLGGVMLDGSDPKGFEVLRRALESSPGGAVDNFSLIGWEAMGLERFEEARVWAERALGAADEGEGGQDLLQRQVPQLAALALGRTGQPEKGLELLERAQSLLKPGQELPGRLEIKAELLLQAGRPDEAQALLGGAPMKPLAQLSGYQLSVRRRVAAAAGDKRASQSLQKTIEDYLAHPTSLPADPVFAYHLRQALGVPPGPPRANLATPDSSFAEVAAGLERLRQREPGNSALAKLSIADLKRLARGSRENEIFVQPVLLEHSVAFVYVSPNRVGLLEVFCERARLDLALEKLQDRLSSPNSDLLLEKAEWRYLSSRLVVPWRTHFPKATRLRWLADSSLVELPLSFLPDQKGRLGQSMSILYLDGPQVSETSLKGARALLVGGAADLPGSSAELETVRRMFPEGVLWRLDGDFAQLRKEAGQSRLLHISTHGAIPSRSSPSGQLRGDGSSLSAFQLSELILPKGSLAVIAACESRVDAGTGRDNTSLSAALRAAGGDQVVGSLWELDDKATADLFEAFYSAIRAGDAPDVALQKAQGITARKWPHPYYWAGLQVVTGP